MAQGHYRTPFKKALLQLITEPDPFLAMLKWVMTEMTRIEAEAKFGAIKGKHTRERTVLYRVLFYHFERFVAEYESRFEREHGFFRPIVKEVVERRRSLCPWTRPSRISPGPRASQSVRPAPKGPGTAPCRPLSRVRATNSPSPVSQAGVESVKIELIRHSPRETAS